MIHIVMGFLETVEKLHNFLFSFFSSRWERDLCGHHRDTTALLDGPETADTKSGRWQRLSLDSWQVRAAMEGGVMHASSAAKQGDGSEANNDGLTVRRQEQCPRGHSVRGNDNSAMME